MPTIRALRTTISDGVTNYPIFLGYLSASDLASVAEVPSFSSSSTNDAIARNILNPPVKDWQRPLIDSKWRAIRDKFSQPGELMPNPVLLAVGDPTRVLVKQQMLHGQTTELFEIEVGASGSDGRAALWILDGQHRVRGMSESSNSNNPIPLVLLHGHGAGGYTPQQFAKVFAEVTTSATPLNELHGDWLQYAFRLDDYASPAPGSETASWNAMTAAAHLCDLQAVGSPPAPNPFHGRIQFNPELQPMNSTLGGFSHTSLTLKAILKAEYFDRPNATLSPKSLAEQVALAVLALAATDTTTTSNSSYFGDRTHKQTYAQDAFLIGVCRYLGKHGVPKDWATVLQKLNFNGADWDFSPWVETTGGNSGNVSRKVANQVFQQVFEADALPAGTADIPAYLQGDAAMLTLKSAELLPSGRPRRTGHSTTQYPLGGTKTLNLSVHRHIKLTDLTSNIGKLECIDQAKPFDSTFSVSNLKRGIALPVSPGNVRLRINAEFFGGVRSELTLTLTWS